MDQFFCTAGRGTEQFVENELQEKAIARKVICDLGDNASWELHWCLTQSGNADNARVTTVASQHFLF